MNMSYCRFQNTLLDLKDCNYNLPNEDLSHEEARAFAELVMLCKDIAERFEDYDYNELKDLAI
jgi:hypothetical protein